MILGIDLATVNCGLCFMDIDETCSFATIGMKNLEDKTIVNFADSLSLLVHDQDCFIDFHFNECFLPNKKKHVALKYYLAGNIQRSAKSYRFVKPSAVREHFGFPPKMKKYEFHEQMFIDHLRQENEHERDAYLLALMGLQLQRMKND
jgi:hypothetical protein